MSRLNSYDDWSPLREVILGSAENYISHERELSFDLFFYDQLAEGNSFYDEMYYPRLGLPSGTNDEPSKRSPIKKRYLEELNEDVEDMAEVFASLGVRVLRPMPLREAHHVRTPAWSAAVVPPLNIRDNTLILGDEIIETPPLVRARYFETKFLARVFRDYFDRGARWTVMPRPWMTDGSFDLSYARGGGGPTESITDPQPSAYDVGHEMMFDGAQVLRLGRDLLVNTSTANHAAACDWLERHLAGRFRLHRVHGLADNHIDSMVLALRPGLLLVRTPKVFEALPEALRRWDVIYPPEPESNNFPLYDNDDLVLTSKYIDLNVVSAGPDTVLVNEASPELARVLERRGFTVVPVRHRHRRLFGGGLHCFTLDTVRDGSAPEDYLD